MLVLLLMKLCVTKKDVIAKGIKPKWNLKDARADITSQPIEYHQERTREISIETVRFADVLNSKEDE